jgi:hypothetical protein
LASRDKTNLTELLEEMRSVLVSASWSSDEVLLSYIKGLELAEPRFKDSRTQNSIPPSEAQNQVTTGSSSTLV